MSTIILYSISKIDIFCQFLRGPVESFYFFMSLHRKKIELKEITKESQNMRLLKKNAFFVLFILH